MALKVVSFDPGKVSGIAGSDDKILTTAHKIDAGHIRKIEDRAFFIAEKALELYAGWFPIDVLVIEYPQVYDPRHQKGDQDDILGLALIGGAVLHALPAKTLILTRPNQWKGQVPKKIHNERVVNKLIASEKKLLAEVKFDHNVIDSVGLNLWYLNRRV